MIPGNRQTSKPSGTITDKPSEEGYHQGKAVTVIHSKVFCKRRQSSEDSSPRRKFIKRGSSLKGSKEQQPDKLKDKKDENDSIRIVQRGKSGKRRKKEDKNKSTSCDEKKRKKKEKEQSNNEFNNQKDDHKMQVQSERDYYNLCDHSKNAITAANIDESNKSDLSKSVKLDEPKHKTEQPHSERTIIPNEQQTIESSKLSTSTQLDNSFVHKNSTQFTKKIYIPNKIQSPIITSQSLDTINTNNEPINTSPRADKNACYINVTKVNINRFNQAINPSLSPPQQQLPIEVKRGSLLFRGEILSATGSFNQIGIQQNCNSQIFSKNSQFPPSSIFVSRNSSKEKTQLYARSLHESPQSELKNPSTATKIVVSDCNHSAYLIAGRTNYYSSSQYPTQISGDSRLGLNDCSINGSFQKKDSSCEGVTVAKNKGFLSVRSIKIDSEEAAGLAGAASTATERGGGLLLSNNDKSPRKQFLLKNIANLSPNSRQLISTNSIGMSSSRYSSSNSNYVTQNTYNYNPNSISSRAYNNQNSSPKTLLRIQLRKNQLSPPKSLSSGQSNQMDSSRPKTPTTKLIKINNNNEATLTQNHNNNGQVLQQHFSSQSADQQHQTQSQLESSQNHQSNSQKLYPSSSFSRMHNFQNQQIYFDVIDQECEIECRQLNLLHMRQLQKSQNDRETKAGCFAVFHFDGVLGKYDKSFFGNIQPDEEDEIENQEEEDDEDKDMEKIKDKWEKEQERDNTAENTPFNQDNSKESNKVFSRANHNESQDSSSSGSSSYKCNHSGFQSSNSLHDSLNHQHRDEIYSPSVRTYEEAKFRERNHNNNSIHSDNCSDGRQRKCPLLPLNIQTPNSMVMLSDLSQVIARIAQIYKVIVIVENDRIQWSQILNSYDIQFDAIYAISNKQNNKQLKQNDGFKCSISENNPGCLLGGGNISSNGEKIDFHNKIFLDYNKILDDFRQKALPRKFIIFQELFNQSYLQPVQEDFQKISSSISPCLQKLRVQYQQDIPLYLPKVRCSKSALRVICLLGNPNYQPYSMNQTSQQGQYQFYFAASLLEDIVIEFLTEFGETQYLEKYHELWQSLDLTIPIESLESKFKKEVSFQLKKKEFYGQLRTFLRQLNAGKTDKKKQIIQAGGGSLNNNINNNTNPPKQESEPSPSLEFLIKQKIGKYFQPDKGGEKGWEGQKKFNVATLNCNIESLVSRNQKAIKSLASTRDELEGFAKERINGATEGTTKLGLNYQNQMNSKVSVKQVQPDLSNLEDQQTLTLIKKYADSVLVYYPKRLQ